MNKRLINFLLTILFVVIVGAWIYTSVRDEFLKQSRAFSVVQLRQSRLVIRLNLKTLKAG